MKDLRSLPKVRDSWSYLYIEHARIDRDANAVLVTDAAGRVPVPCAALNVLLLGPGTTITHAAVDVLARSGTLVQWVGEEGTRFYAQGLGDTRSGLAALRQAALVSHPDARLAVVRRMYAMRFAEDLDPTLSLRQIRGKEGARVRAAYAALAREHGVEWTGRSYDRGNWAGATSINRALSAANACLYGVCHSAIVSLGLSPALGFIHTGKALSFVYDIADLYKTETSVPAAFREATGSPKDLEPRVRRGCRDLFRQSRLLVRVVDDIQTLMGLHRGAPDPYEWDASKAGMLWDPEGQFLPGGANFADGDEFP